MNVQLGHLLHWCVVHEVSVPELQSHSLHPSGCGTLAPDVYVTPPNTQAENEFKNKR
mgnify:CR=1 FL=1